MSQIFSKELSDALENARGPVHMALAESIEGLLFLVTKPVLAAVNILHSPGSVCIDLAEEVSFVETETDGPMPVMIVNDEIIFVFKSHAHLKGLKLKVGTVVKIKGDL